jgi:hypothetical protein
MGSYKKLIVNADGFGFGPGATQGVMDAIREGKFISSVSINANFPDVEQVRELVTKFPHLSLGVHLNPMVGGPCLPADQAPSLVGPDGFFHGGSFLRLLRSGAIVFAELEAELDAQAGSKVGVVPHAQQRIGDLLGSTPAPTVTLESLSAQAPRVVGALLSQISDVEGSGSRDAYGRSIGDGWVCGDGQQGKPRQLAAHLAEPASRDA